MNLHDAIVLILKEEGHPLTCSAIAEKIHKRKLYIKGNKTPLKGRQISARINQYQFLFKKDKTYTPMLISLAD